MADLHCTGEHHYFLADVAVVHIEGKVCLLALCTACGKSIMNEHKVTSLAHLPPDGIQIQRKQTK